MEFFSIFPRVRVSGVRWGVNLHLFTPLDETMCICAYAKCIYNVMYVHIYNQGGPQGGLIEARRTGWKIILFQSWVDIPRIYIIYVLVMFAFRRLYFRVDPEKNRVGVSTK